MICLQTVKQFCKEYWKIENYDQAMADESQVWHCHHRHEIDWALPREELIAIGRYYDVHYSELIFLTPGEHSRLHNAGENNPNYGKEGYWKGKVGPNKGKEGYWKGKEGYWKGKEGPNNGKHHTEETKAKMSDANQGENNPMYGVHRFGENAPNYKYHITEEELYDLYVVQGLSTYRIADLYGCSQMCICLKLKKFNISKSKS